MFIIQSSQRQTGAGMEKYRSKGMSKMLTLIIVVLGLLQNFSVEAVSLVNTEIVQKIFHEYKIYIIYAREEVDIGVESYFNQFCNDGHLCAVLEPSVKNYENLKGFVGEVVKKEYFFIIDAARKQKYILPILKGMSSTDLHIFHSKFENDELEPFLASQLPDPHPYKPCRKVVGKDIQKYLQEQTPVRVVFLHTKNSACEFCGEMLRQYADLAEKMYDDQIVSFAYYDIFLNDNPAITDQILPFFLIYVAGQSQPFGVEGERIDELQETIVEIVMKGTDIDVSKYRRQAMQEIRESLMKGEMEGIRNGEDLQTFLRQKNIQLESSPERQNQFKSDIGRKMHNVEDWEDGEQIPIGDL